MLAGSYIRPVQLEPLQQLGGLRHLQDLTELALVAGVLLVGKVHRQALDVMALLVERVLVVAPDGFAWAAVVASLEGAEPQPSPAPQSPPLLPGRWPCHGLCTCTCRNNGSPERNEDCMAQAPMGIMHGWSSAAWKPAPDEPHAATACCTSLLHKTQACCARHVSHAACCQHGPNMNAYSYRYWTALKPMQTSRLMWQLERRLGKRL